MKLIKWVKTLFRIVQVYDTEWTNQHNRILYLEKILRERTEISVDVSPSRKGINNIILMGRWRDRDFIQTYEIQGGDFDYLVNMLRNMERTATVRRIDGPPIFSEVFERHRREWQ